MAKKSISELEQVETLDKNDLFVLSRYDNGEYVTKALSGGGFNSLYGPAHYQLVDAQLQPASQGLSCQVEDYAITTISISSSQTDISVFLPTKPTGNGARDFILRFEISASTVPGISFVGAGNEAIQYDAEDDEWYVLEPGINLVSFTETKC